MRDQGVFPGAVIEDLQDDEFARLFDPDMATMAEDDLEIIDTLVGPCGGSSCSCSCIGPGTDAGGCCG
jgi:hypothetical protein